MQKNSFEVRTKKRLATEKVAVEPDVFSMVFDLMRVANRLIQDFETNVHRPLGMSWAGFRLLFCTWVEGEVEPRRLAELCAVSRATTSSGLNTLERDGLLKRERRSADRRVVTVSLTAKGRRIVVKAFRLQHAREQRWLRGLKRKELGSLIATLRTLLRVSMENCEDTSA